MNKREELHHLLESTRTDIVVGTESWLTHDINDYDGFPPDFTVYLETETCDEGGVFIAVRADGFSSREKDLETECEILWIK